MKNNRIIKAYDTVTPTREQKDRMLHAILQEADLKDAPVKQPKKKEPIVYTATPTRTSKKSVIGTIAASLAIFAVSAAVLVQVLRQPENPAAVAPTETTPSTEAETSELVFPAEPTHYGVYNAIIADYVGYLNGTLSNPTCIPEKLQEFMDSRDTSGLGWIVYDVNEDGIEELLIGDGELIYQAITMDEDGGGCPVLFTTMEEEQYYRCQDGIFCKVSDYGSDYVQYDFFEVKMDYPGFREIREVVICDNGQYRIGKTEEKAVAVDESTAQWTLGEKYLRERLFVTPFLKETQTEEPAQNLTGIEPYDDILEKYAQAVDQGYTEVNFSAFDLSPMIAEDRAHGDLGWCLLDIDNNGQEELLIGTTDRLYDLYTIKPDGIRQVVVSRAGNHHALCQNGYLVMTQIQGDDLPWFKSYFKYENGRIIEEEGISYVEVESASGNYWQYYQGASTSSQLRQPVSKDEAGRIMGEYIQQELFVTRFMPRDPDAYDTDGTYAETLQLYRKALTEGWSPALCGAKDLSMQLTDYYDRPGDIGYTFLNLDGGEEELLITNGSTILNLFTVKDGTVEAVFIGADRHTYWLLEENQILRRKLTAKDEEYYIVYKLVHPNVAQKHGLVVQEAYVRKTADDPKAPWYFSPDGEGYGDPCGSFDAEKRIKELMASTQQLSFRRFN